MVIIRFSVYVVCAELRGMTAVSIAISGHGNDKLKEVCQKGHAFVTNVA